MANVQCQYDSPETEGQGERRDTDHNYDTRDEPPAFIIHQIPAQQAALASPFMELSPKVMTLAPASGARGAALSVVHVGDHAQNKVGPGGCEYISKRTRRSEAVLRQAAECVSQGLTFQTVSDQFNIPISTIRFFMARKGILPKRRRGRSTILPRSCTSPEPPFHMQHYKLPDMLALRSDSQDENE